MMHTKQIFNQKEPARKMKKQQSWGNIDCLQGGSKGVNWKREKSWYDISNLPIGLDEVGWTSIYSALMEVSDSKKVEKIRLISMIPKEQVNYERYDHYVALYVLCQAVTTSLQL